MFLSYSNDLLPFFTYTCSSCLDYSSLFYLIIAIIYTVLVLLSVISEVQCLMKLHWSYIFRFWTYINWAIVVCSWSAIGLFSQRFREIKRVQQFIHETKARQFISFRPLMNLDEGFTILLALSCFFSSLRFLYFSRFSRRLSLIINVFQYAKKNLIGATLIFAVIYFSFILLFYFLFGSKVLYCSDLISTGQMLMRMTLLKASTVDIVTVEPMLGPVCIILFLICLILIGASMFLPIFMDSYHCSRQQRRTEPTWDDDFDLFEFMWDRFQRMTS